MMYRYLRADGSVGPVAEGPEVAKFVGAAVLLEPAFQDANHCEMFVLEYMAPWLKMLSTAAFNYSWMTAGNFASPPTEHGPYTETVSEGRTCKQSTRRRCSNIMTCKRTQLTYRDQPFSMYGVEKRKSSVGLCLV